jgi:hypothetical protein
MLIIADFLFWLAVFWVALMAGGVWSGYWIHQDWKKKKNDKREGR